MSSEENKEIYRRYIEDVFNKRRLEMLEYYVAQNYVLHDAPEHLPNGRKSIIGIVEMFRKAFSDFHITIDELISENDLVASKLTFVGTHSAPVFGLPATGRKVKITSLTLVRVSEGKLKESWENNGLEELKKQLTR